MPMNAQCLTWTLHVSEDFPGDAHSFSRAYQNYSLDEDAYQTGTCVFQIPWFVADCFISEWQTGFLFLSFSPLSDSWFGSGRS